MQLLKITSTPIEYEIKIEKASLQMPVDQPQRVTQTTPAQLSVDTTPTTHRIDSSEFRRNVNMRSNIDYASETARIARENADEVVNEYSEAELRRVIFEYGEERFSARIAAAIVKARELSSIKTTGELTEIIKSAIPKALRIDGPHPAKRTFQAIRIEVNRELDSIRPLIEDAVSALVSGGRIAIISFHSLEDRIVKQTYKSLTAGCTCPKDFPVCICGNKPKIKDITKKPTLPSEDELNANPRSRSAKLRVAEKI